MNTKIINNGNQILYEVVEEIVCPKCKGSAGALCICRGTGKMQLKKEIIKDIQITIHGEPVDFEKESII